MSKKRRNKKADSQPVENLNVANEPQIVDESQQEEIINSDLTQEDLIQGDLIQENAVEISETENFDAFQDVDPDPSLQVQPHENLPDELYSEEENYEPVHVYDMDTSQDINEDVGQEYGSFDRKKNNKTRKASDESFSGFIKEYFAHVKERIKTNKKSFTIGCSVVLGVAVIAVIVVIISNITSKQPSVSQSSVSELAVSDNVLEIPTDGYETDAYPEVNALIESYFTARQSDDIALLNSIQQDVDSVEAAKYEVLSKYIEQYTVKNCYTKKGPFDNSYIVYAVFDVKMTGYDVVAPGLQTFVVCTADDGSLYIFSGDFDEKIADYISQVSAQEDVAELMQRVSVEYNDILASNQEFADYMSTFKSVIKSEIGDKLAVIEDKDSSSDNNAKEENTNNTSESTGNESFQVKANTTVNVRAADSENADKLGKVSEGTVLTCRQHKDNGWSEIEYEGQTGYIKTEFLTDANGETAGVKTNGTVMVGETVKIRKSPSTDADSIGVIYAGQTVDLIEKQDNGWTKVLYNGVEAYISSEFILN